MNSSNRKVAIITGASSGIGADCALALAKKGFSICITARRENLLYEMKNKLDVYTKVIAIPGDVTTDLHRRDIIRMVMAKFGRIDLLINNAGVAWGGVVEDIDLDEMRKQFEVNTIAPLAMMQMVGPIMREQNSGRIINVSSISGIMSVPGLGGYAASKYAIEALSDAARREYDAWNIKVILIEPGGIATEMWKSGQKQISRMQARSKSAAFKKFYEKQKQRYLNDLATGKGASVDIVTKAIVHAATSKRPKTRYCMPYQCAIRKVFSHFPTKLEDKLLTLYIKVTK